jgi:hypothetical protein
MSSAMTSSITDGPIQPTCCIPAANKTRANKGGTLKSYSWVNWFVNDLYDNGTLENHRQRRA